MIPYFHIIPPDIQSVAYLKTLRPHPAKKRNI